ncbi:unnamed protein product [Pseudo-nitzschia multistriata]|uniref:Gamma-secretase subunit PEN-2 n=1 Tax=Pseudo-nitzschia multistriata TaxID=183589 RepID=A0A448YXZ8_9STRA|nr:unnamed protein product [Pseudo-nitzschia multistriata]
MSSAPTEEPSTPPEGLRDDELSKRFYYGGLLGLPWLWIVHALHFHGKQRQLEAQRILREEQEHNSESSSSHPDTDNQYAEAEKMWVRRGRNSAVVVSGAWLAWVLFVQLIFPDTLPSSWYVRDPNSYAATGW